MSFANLLVSSCVPASHKWTCKPLIKERAIAKLESVTYVCCLFCRVSKEKPDLSSREIMRELASTWKTLSDSQKAASSK